MEIMGTPGDSTKMQHVDSRKAPCPLCRVNAQPCRAFKNNFCFGPCGLFLVCLLANLLKVFCMDLYEKFTLGVIWLSFTVINFWGQDHQSLIFIFIFYYFYYPKVKMSGYYPIRSNLKFLTSEKIATIEEDNLELQFNNPKFWHMGAKNNPDLCNNKLC